MSEQLLARLNGSGFRLIMVADVLALNAIMYGTNFVRFGVNWPDSLELFVFSFSIATIVLLSTLYFGGLYEREPHLGAQPVFPRVFRLMLVGGGVVALVTLASSGIFREFTFSGSQRLPFPFLNLMALIVLGSAILTLIRILSRRHQRQRIGRFTVLLAGNPVDVAAVSDQFSREDQDFVIVGAITKPSDLLTQVSALSPTDLMVVSPSWISDNGEQLVHLLDRWGLNILIRVRGIDTILGLKQISQVAGLPFVHIRATALPLSQAHLKRFIDLVLVIGLGPVWLILYALVALYQLIVAGKPNLFVQHRVGLENRTFPMLKFRTMALEAEDQTGPILSSSDDDRVIPACRWLRATRMDELPQLFNVLSGHMSIVGPRPERPELIANFEAGIQGYRLRHSLRPGLTGLAQIYGHYDTGPEYKLGYDLHYAVNWSAWLDAQILFRTIFVVLGRRV